MIDPFAISDESLSLIGQLMNIGTYTLTSKRPAVMGIINATPDSFSDGGLHFGPQAAIEGALRLAQEGADLIDIGGESTRPGADHVPPQMQIQRIAPVIVGIREVDSIPISIDTTSAEVACAALDAGANMINDISAGRDDPDMFALAAERGCPICLMHMQGTPATMQLDPHYDDLLEEVGAFLEERAGCAQDEGVDRARILIDPGIGFGKGVQDNVMLLRQLQSIADRGYPILIGPSRKSFIGKLLGLDVENRLEATLASIGVARQGGAQIFRVHDAGAARRFLDMFECLKSPLQP